MKTTADNLLETGRKEMFDLFKIEKSSIEGLSGEIYSVATANGGPYIVTGSSDKTIGIWSIAELKLLHRFEKAHSNVILSVAVTNTRGYIVSGSADKTIGIWSIAELKLLHQFEPAHSDSVWSVTVTSDSKHIVSGSWDQSIGIWDIAEKKLLHRIEQAHSDKIWSVAVTSDNQYIVSGSDDKTIAVWNIEGGKLLHRFEKAHSNAIFSVTVTNDNRFIVSGSWDKSIRVWDIAEKKILHRIEQAHSESIWSVKVTSDNKYIVSGSVDKTIGVWDIAEKKLLHRIEQAHSHAIFSVTVTNDNQYIISGSLDKTIGVWNIGENKLLHRFQKAHSKVIYSVTVTSDNQYIVSCSSDKTIGVWDIAEKKLLHRFEQAHSESITSVGVTSDNKYIVSGSRDKTLGVWDIAEKKLLHRFEQAHSSEITSVGVTSDNKYIVSGSHDKTIGVWDIAEKKLLHRFEQAHSSVIFSVTVTSDNQYIVSGSADKTIGVWDIGEKKILHRFEQAHSDKIWSVAVTSDNKHIVSGSSDKTIGVWNIEEKKLFHRFEEAHSNIICSVTVTSDNQYIVSGSADKTIGVWDIEEKKILHRFEQAHADSIESVAVTNDKYIISGSLDMAIGVWDIGKIMGSSNDSRFYPRVNYFLHSLEKSNPTLSMFSEFQCIPQRWNALNIFLFLLPDAASLEFIDFAINHKIYLTFDIHGLTQLDYLLQYNGEKTSQIDEFCSYFFRSMPSLLDYRCPARNQVLRSISRATQQIFSDYGEPNFLMALNSLCTSNTTDGVHYISNSGILPKSGYLNNRKSKDFIVFEGTAVNEADISKAVSTKHKDYSINYSVLLYDFSYQITDNQLLWLFRILNGIDSNNLLCPAVQNLVNYLWEKKKRLMWAKCTFYGSVLGIFVSFAVTRTVENDTASKLLIALDVFTGVIVLFESLQMTSNLRGYLNDLWNYLDMFLVSDVIVISALFWTHSSIRVLSFFISTGAVLFFTKTLLAFRTVDQLRNLIRMILEVIKDMTSFLVVIISYLVAFSIIFFQTRRAIGDDSFDSGNFGNDLMEMFYLIFTGGDYSEYSGVMIPFYILVTVFQCLILLNLIISIMGDTYDRVKGDFDIIDLREKVNMILELAEEANILTKITEKLSRQMKKLSCFRRNALVHAASEESNPQSRSNSNEGTFLLVVERFEIKNSSNLSIQDLDKRISSNLSNVSSSVAQMRSELENRISSMRVELNAVSSMETRLQNSIISEMENKLESKMIAMETRLENSMKYWLETMLKATDSKLNGGSMKETESKEFQKKEPEHNNLRPLELQDEKSNDSLKHQPIQEESLE